MKKFISSIVVLSAVLLNSAYAGDTKQSIEKMDSTVKLENSGLAAMTILGGKATVNAGSAIASNGVTQKIGSFKSTVVLKNSGAAAMTILGGEATLNLASAIAK